MITQDIITPIQGRRGVTVIQRKQLQLTVMVGLTLNSPTLRVMLANLLRRETRVSRLPQCHHELPPLKLHLPLLRKNV